MMALEFDHRSERRGPSMRPARRTRTRIALAVVAMAVGVLIGMQIAQRGDEPARLAAESPQDLTRILADLNAEADALGRQVTELRLRLFRYRDAAGREELALQDARKALQDLQVLAGVTPVRGPGVVLRIQDPRSRVSWESFLDLVQELRDAGAEAIAVNGRRLVASTWFGPDDAGVVVDGEVVAPPYRLDAIGTPRDLREALGIPGGPLSLVQAQPGVGVTVQESERLELPPLQRQTTFRYARPAG